MEHLDFTLFSTAVNKKFQELAKDSQKVLLVADYDPDSLYETYLNSYPAEVNGIFRTRRHYDGSYDKNYIRRLGNIVAVDKDGNRDTIWNVQVPGYFQDVADTMHRAVVNADLKTYFFTDQPTAGSKSNKDSELDIVWTHFHSEIPSLYVKRKINIGTTLSSLEGTLQVFKRGLEELKITDLETVKELIDANSLYRGEEHRKAVTDFLAVSKAFQKVPKEKRQAWTMWSAVNEGPKLRFKNTVIGTLVSDLSEGVELERAVASFESKVAPTNYKRPTALVTRKMLENAQAKIEELGLMSALDRRYATIEDISVNNVLFTSRNEKALNVFDELVDDASSKVSPQSLAKVEEVSLDHFINNIIPNAKTVEVLFEGKHQNNLVSLTTSTEADAPNLFKWNNNFAWTYNGEVADSMKERVKAHGGNVEGDLRFSIQWNTPEDPNTSDLDAHASGPSGHIFFGRKRGTCSGSLDVDIIRPSSGVIAVENIIYTDREKMLPGVYSLYVNNYSQRVGKGFSAEIEFDGQIYSYYHSKKISDGGHVQVGKVELTKSREFKLVEFAGSKNPGAAPSVDIWGISTNRWVKVNNILLSPNVWDEEKRTGNEHLFFIIDGCKNPDSSRGIYNEFLRPEFEAHRKVFELLGSKTKVPYSDKQASGLGFSSTRREKVTVRVTGKTIRTFVINL